MQLQISDLCPMPRGIVLIILIRSKAFILTCQSQWLSTTFHLTKFYQSRHIKVYLGGVIGSQIGNIPNIKQPKNKNVQKIGNSN